MGVVRPVSSSRDRSRTAHSSVPTWPAAGRPGFRVADGGSGTRGALHTAGSRPLFR